MKITVLAILSLSLLVGCGINSTLSATKSMPGKMDDTLNQMKKTNETVEQEPVAIALEKMQDPQNGLALTPIPFDIMPWAETFGKYASNDQIIKIVYLWVQKLNQRAIEASPPTADQIAAFNHQQLQTLYALESVCGLLSDEKVQQIVADQITGAGRFQKAAMQMLMLRVIFIRDVMVHASLLSDPLDNAGKLEFGVNYANSIEYVARLPFAADISVDIFGFLSPMTGVKESMTPATALGIWTDIKSAVAIPATSQVTRQQKALATINAKINGWGGTP